MKIIILIRKTTLITFLMIFGSIFSLSAQQELRPHTYKSSMSLGVNYAFVPKWEVKTTTSLTLSYKRLLKTPSFAIEGNLDMLGYIFPEPPNQSILPSSLTDPISLSYYMYSALLSYSFLNEEGNPRNFSFSMGPSLRFGFESYHLQVSAIDGLIFLRKASDWGVAAKIAYQQPLSKRFSLKVSGQYQYYFSSRPSEDYDFQASLRVFQFGGALVFNM